MIVKGSFTDCAARLLYLMSDKEGVQFVLVKENIGNEYVLYGLEDPDLDWSKATSGEMRVVMCVSQFEINNLKTILKLRGK